MFTCSEFLRRAALRMPFVPGHRLAAAALALLHLLPAGVRPVGAQEQPLFAPSATVQLASSAGPSPLRAAPRELLQADLQGEVRAVLTDLTALLPRHVALDALDLFADAGGGPDHIVFSLDGDAMLPDATGMPRRVFASDLLAWQRGAPGVSVWARLRDAGASPGADVDALVILDAAAKSFVVSFDVALSLPVGGVPTVVPPYRGVLFEAGAATSVALTLAVPPLSRGANLVALGGLTGNVGLAAGFDTTVRLTANNVQSGQVETVTVPHGSVVAIAATGGLPVFPPALGAANLPLRRGVHVGAIAFPPGWVADGGGFPAGRHGLLTF